MCFRQAVRLRVMGRRDGITPFMSPRDAMAREGETLRGFRAVFTSSGHALGLQVREARPRVRCALCCSLGVRDTVDVERKAPRQRLPERNAADPEAIGRFLKSVSIASLRVTQPTSRARGLLRISFRHLREDEAL